MDKIDLINTFVKMFVISFFIYITYAKIINYKSKKLNYVIVLLISSMISILYLISQRFIPSLMRIMILYIIYGICINKITNNKINYITYIYSCVIAYGIYLISILISGILLLLVLDKSEYRSPISLITIPSIAILLFTFIFTRKRYKNGLNFLKNKVDSKYLKIFAIFWTGIVFIIFGFLQKMRHWITGMSFIIGSTLVMISLLFWIKSQITKTYKSRMRDRTIEMQKAEIDEQARIMEELKAENLNFAKAIHKYNKKISALELAMENALKIEMNTEFSNELSVILKETTEASKNFAKEVETTVKKLPLTNNVGIDNMFKYMQEEARKKEINFDFKLNASINPLIETIISKDKFETIIGDHLKDAIIAVVSSEKSYKSILVTFGLVDGNYEFSVYDTGIEFEIDTLLKLGKEQITTHKDEGGSGIGFITTFETLRECKASLIIEEYNPEATNYTKAVIIRFDGKKQYKICSYRANEIKKQNYGRKILIEQLK